MLLLPVGCPLYFYTVYRVQWAVLSLEVKLHHWSYTLPRCLKNITFKKVLMSGKTTACFIFLWVDRFPWSSQCFGWWWNVTLLVIQWREIQFTMGCFLQLAVYHYTFWQVARQYCQSHWKEPQSSVLQAWQQWTGESDSSMRTWAVEPHICWNLFFFISTVPPDCSDTLIFAL